MYGATTPGEHPPPFQAPGYYGGGGPGPNGPPPGMGGPPLPGGYYGPPQQGPPGAVGFPPQGGGSYPQRPPQGGTYPPPQGGGYGPPQGGVPPQQGGYPTQSGSYPQQGCSAQAGPAAHSYQGPALPGQTGGPGAWQPEQGDERHTWDNLPEKPIEDDPNRGPPRYQPPPLPAGMQNIPGYEGTGGYGQFVPLPAPPALPPPQGEPPKMDFDDVANLSEQDCRDAFMSFVAENCCYGKGCATDHRIQKITPSTALHYTLETYCEGRSTGYKHEPYRGGPVDGPENGTPPLPWQLQCTFDELFLNHTKKLEVPHTAHVQTCDCCSGRGFVRCWRCHGLGRVRCTYCNGDGKTRRHDPDQGWYDDPCNMCGADGWRRCMTCNGSGSVKCSECLGYRRIKAFIELSVNFVNHVSEYILEETDMPDELVKNVHGTTVFEQVLPRVWPVIAYPVLHINVNSQRLVEEHRVGFPNERHLQQRQVLRALPVTEVVYKWKDMKSCYWVYGREMKVYCPDYPQSCCWGCEML